MTLLGLRAQVLLAQLIAFGWPTVAAPDATAAVDAPAPADGEAATPKIDPDKNKSACGKQAPASDEEPDKPAKDEPVKSPVDVQPANCRDSATCPKTAAQRPGEKVIEIGEDFAIQSESPAFVTETDRVVVRFIVRKALACRVYAQADAATKWQPSVFRYGGDVQLLRLPEEKSNAFTDRMVEKAKPPRSCGFDLAPADGAAPDYRPTGEGAKYEWVDFRMGPFTDDEIVIHLYRFDRGFTGYDREGTIKIVNHKRYSGWIDLAGGVNALAEQNTSATVVRDPFSGVSRVALKQGHDATLDFMAFVKYYVWCDGSAPFSRADVQASTVCLGPAAGLSLREPLDRFYPIGVSLTLGGSLSVNAMLSLSVVRSAAPDLAAGAPTADEVATLNSVSSIKAGFALALGVDPSIFASLVKAAVGFK